jgi:hypothetical protein
MEVPRPVVHNDKSKAKGFYDGEPKGRGRRAKRACSCFVLIAAAFAALGNYVTGAVEVRVGVFPVAKPLPTVNSPEQSVSRESEAPANRTDTAEASLTRCWCQFQRA